MWTENILRGVFKFTRVSVDGASVRWSYLWCDITADKMLHESFIVMYQHVLHHTKNVHRRVRKKFKPVLTPIYWHEKKIDN